MAFPPAVAENRCFYRVVSSADYRYQERARRVVTILRLCPPPSRGLQTVHERRVHVAPLPLSDPERQDDWGNVVLETHHDFVREHLTFAVELRVENACLYGENGRALPTPVRLPTAPTDDAPYLRFTRRTTPTSDMERVARELTDANDPRHEPFRFAEMLCARVHREITFVSGATGVGTTAAEAWNLRRGVCQDYAHIALALCRLVGVPARYVSGFVPGEGVMHAWIEARLPGGTTDGGEEAAAAWYALDPTYNKWVDERYISVAVGGDYGDATPMSGTYYGGKSSLTYGTRVETLKRKMRVL